METVGLYFSQGPMSQRERHPRQFLGRAEQFRLTPVRIALRTNPPYHAELPSPMETTDDDISDVADEEGGGFWASREIELHQLARSSFKSSTPQSLPRYAPTPLIYFTFLVVTWIML